MENEHQRFFFTMIVAILLVNSLTLFGVLSILSDHEITRISSGIGINSPPGPAISASKPVTIPKDPQVASQSPWGVPITGSIAKESPLALDSENSSIVISTIPDSPVAGLMSEQIFERGGTQARDSVHQENPASANATSATTNSSQGDGFGTSDISLPLVLTQNSYVTLVYANTTQPSSYDAMADENPNVDAPLFPIYEMKDEDTSKVLPEIQYDLKNPPMTIKCDVTITNITRLKHVEFKKLAEYFEEDILYERPSEMGWFVISVRNRDTGELVDEVGLGRQYGLQPLPQITIRKAGRYSIMIDGFFAKINSFEIDVKREGNVP